MALVDGKITDRIIGAAIEVHRALGPGFLESVYEEALAVELEAQSIPFERQKSIRIMYKSKPVGEHRLDFYIEGVVVELKAVKELDSIFFATVRSYMKALNTSTGLILNFATMPLTIKRVSRERNELGTPENQEGEQN